MNLNYESDYWGNARIIIGKIIELFRVIRVSRALLQVDW